MKKKTERLQEKAQNCYHQEDGKEQAKKNMKTIKKDY